MEFGVVDGWRCEGYTTKFVVLVDGSVDGGVEAFLVRWRGFVAKWAIGVHIDGFQKSHC